MILAIQGHPTRGSEVIALLEMLGGVNKYNLKGNEDEWYVLNGKQIQRSDYLFCQKGFTLEQFLEKFPYKVGDKVKCWINGYCSINNIKDIQWDCIANEVKYKIDNYWYSTMNLQPYKEETMETITIDDFKANTKEWLIDKLESMSKDNALQAICNIHDELHKSQYPKTYEECCEVLGISYNKGFGFINLSEYENILMSHFIQLIRCRDAYWKIAGKQMGLGKPWEPDWNNSSTPRGFIKINKGRFIHSSRVLVFPPSEIGDIFCENFKELIEQCKELL